MDDFMDGQTNSRTKEGTNEQTNQQPDDESNYTGIILNQRHQSLSLSFRLSFFTASL